MMSLYSLCLKTTISFEKIKIHDLPICIQNDLDKLKMYEHTLKEWNISLTLIDEINISIEKQRYAMEVLENQLLWGHGCYEDYEEFESTIETLEHRKQDLELVLGNCETNVVDAKREIVSQIDDKIVDHFSKILDHLEHVYRF